MGRVQWRGSPAPAGASGGRFGPLRALLAGALLAGLCPALPARAEEPAPPPAKAPETEFVRDRLRGKAGETVWFHFEPGNPGTVDLLQRVLGRHGLAHGQHYWFDRQDALGLLAVTAEPRWIDLIRSVLAFLVEEQPQIRVKVRIVEVQSSRDLQTGLETRLDRKTAQDTFFRGYRMNHSPKSYLDSLVSSSSFTGTTAAFGTVETVDAKGNFVSASREREGTADLALRLIGEHQDSKILAEPDLLILNGVQATISTGQGYPYQKVLITGGTARVEVDTIALGVSLVLTPHQVGDDRVSLAINSSVTTLAGLVETGPGTKYPLRVVRSIATNLVVPSGSEIVIGGLYQREYSVVESGVPLLCDIPLVGYLFKSYWRTQRRRELLFFIRPTLVEPHRRFHEPDEK